jgi:hypothetical protein
MLVITMQHRYVYHLPICAIFSYWFARDCVNVSLSFSQETVPRVIMPVEPSDFLRVDINISCHYVSFGITRIYACHYDVLIHY